MVIVGAPYDCSKTTLRPLGPIVDLTVLANLSTPANIFERASSENLISFAIKYSPHIVVNLIKTSQRLQLSRFHEQLSKLHLHI